MNTRLKTIRDLGIGFAAWFAIHSLYCALFEWIYSQFSGAALMLFPCLYAPLLANLGVLLLLVRFRAGRWIALGAFAAFVVNSIWIILFVHVAPGPILYLIIEMNPLFLIRDVIS